MTKEIVFFRGRSTAAIIRDAAQKKLTEGRRVTVVCLDNDRIQESGDVPVSAWRPFCEEVTDLLIVANGGTSRQLAPVLMRAVEAKLRDYYESRAYLEWHSPSARDADEPRNLALRVVDLQPDGLVEVS